MFFAKMGMLLLILALEIWPMITLVRWRLAAGRDGAAWTPEPAAAARIRLLSYIEAAVVIAMVIAAVTMARGFGYRGPG